MKPQLFKQTYETQVETVYQSPWSTLHSVKISFGTQHNKFDNLNVSAKVMLNRSAFSVVTYAAGIRRFKRVTDLPIISVSINPYFMLMEIFKHSGVHVIYLKHDLCYDSSSPLPEILDNFFNGSTTMPENKCRKRPSLDKKTPLSNKPAFIKQSLT